MKVLVTGGAGFLGSHVVDLLVKNGHSVVVVDNLSTGKNINSKIELIEFDINHWGMDIIFDVYKPDVVCHYAANVEVGESVRFPKKDAETNILGAINLLECAKNHKTKHFIYASSAGVYGNPVYFPVDEKHPVEPLSPYGITKHTVEHYLYSYYVNYGIKYTALRFSNVYGPRQNSKDESGVIAIFADKMINNQPITINGDGEQIRDFIYVSDVANANLLALEKEQIGIYNISLGYGVSINAVFEKLKTITGYQMNAEYGPEKLGEIRKIYLDRTKAKLELDWTPSIDLEDGLIEHVRRQNSS